MRVAELGKRFSIEKARKAQLLLSQKIIFEDFLPREIRYVAGVDVAYAGDLAIGAAAVLDYATLNLVESQTAICKTSFPYIPTLLSFREVPPSVLCIKRLKIQPDVFLVDGHGFAHPYRCGFASHLGIVLGKPTIGVAKSKLVGDFEEFKDKDFVYLRHNGEVIGAVLKTVKDRKPVYVSVGHMVSLGTAVKIVRHCIRNGNNPEPVRKAHQIATEKKWKVSN
ncbi:MAG: endonuclease V [Candidatus Bathyarchaeales archaeon]